MLEEVVLLLAEGYDDGPADHCELYQVLNGDDLGKATGVGHLWTPNPTDGKWTPSLLSPDALKAFVALEDSDGFTTLDTWGDTTLGMVTGNNRYFALSPQRVRELGLAASDVMPLSPPGSRHLRGLTFTAAGAAELSAAGSATWLFRPVHRASRRRQRRRTSTRARRPASTRPTSARSGSRGGVSRW